MTVAQDWPFPFPADDLAELSIRVSAQLRILIGSRESLTVHLSSIGLSQEQVPRARLLRNFPFLFPLFKQPPRFGNLFLHSSVVAIGRTRTLPLETGLATTFSKVSHPRSGTKTPLASTTMYYSGHPIPSLHDTQIVTAVCCLLEADVFHSILSSRLFHHPV